MVKLAGTDLIVLTLDVDLAHSSGPDVGSGIVLGVDNVDLLEDVL